MKKIISFSLWGTQPKYTIGAIKNADLAAKYYNDWICRYYCNNNVPINIIESLTAKDNTEVIIEDGPADWTFSVKRFYPISEKETEYVIFRDTDSRLGEREAQAVKQWIESGLSLHIMRDHPFHGNFPILAGMFGIKGGIISNIKDLLIQHEKTKMQYHYDQLFLAKYIYPIVQDSRMVHDEFFEKNNFPTKRNGLEFVGQVFDENDITVTEHLQALALSLK